MSDPMTNIDAVDVLASIRRLVDETHLDDPVPPSDASEALVLTPNLRVVTEVDADAVSDPQDGTATLAPLLLTPDDAVRLPDETVDEAETPKGQGALSDWTVALREDLDEDMTVSAASPERTLEQRIAELEAAVGAQPTEWEPDGSEDPMASTPQEVPRSLVGASARVLHFRKHPKPEAEAELPEPGTGAVTANDDALAEPPLEQEVASLAGPVADQAVPTEEVAEDMPASVEDELALAGYLEDEILDEKSLRGLISQLIREELQGDMGERITRNIRALVRREVQRALALQENLPTQSPRRDD
nr:hypothetical protein [uncultured Celeribacter sp.]